MKLVQAEGTGWAVVSIFIIAVGIYLSWDINDDFSHPNFRLTLFNPRLLFYGNSFISAMRLRLADWSRGQCWSPQGRRNWLTTNRNSKRNPKKLSTRRVKLISILTWSLKPHHGGAHTSVPKLRNGGAHTKIQLLWGSCREPTVSSSIFNHLFAIGITTLLTPETTKRSFGAIWWRNRLPLYQLRPDDLVYGSELCVQHYICDQAEINHFRVRKRLSSPHFIDK
jgi:hypothetical protein